MSRRRRSVRHEPLQPEPAQGLGPVQAPEPELARELEPGREQAPVPEQVPGPERARELEPAFRSWRFRWNRCLR